MLQALEASAFSEWVLVSFWGFPVMIALHSVGMGIAAGLGSVLALRVNGLLSGISVPTLGPLVRVAWWGFGLNLVTGVILLVPRISEYLVDITFLVKMALVLISAALLYFIQRALAAGRYQQLPDQAAVRFLGWLSIVTWVGAITAGRWIAYLSPLYTGGG